MATTPEPPTFRASTTVDFRAPPPSPVASSRRSSVTNDEVLTEFLENSLKVPDLILPDRVFPRQKSIEDPPKLDLHSLASLEKDSILQFVESVAKIGCFQVINHGVSLDLIKSVLAGGGGIFRIPAKKRKMVTRTAERTYGFEEGHGDDDEEMSEEFVWCRDERLMLDMEEIWPLGYSNFSEKLKKLSSDIEMVAEIVLQFLQDNSLKQSHDKKGEILLEKRCRKDGDSLCYFKKNSHSTHAEHDANSLRHDVIRMLIRGSEFSHALCMHICNGCEEFHVYSKKGWASFQADKDSLIVTIGDKLQAWSSGQYKHVIGRPMFKEVGEDCISMALLYAPPDINNTCEEKMLGGDKNISLAQQLMIVVLLSLVYNLWIYFCKN